MNIILRLTIMILSVFVLKLYAQTPLPIPPSLEGPEYDIDIIASSHEFVPGIKTATWGYNGSYLGPTLILKKGEMVEFYIDNMVDEITTIHWHGLDVPANNDGGATFHHHIHPGELVREKFPILNRASTCWYHPHPHENTEAHVVRGLAGMIIVQDDEEAVLDLPRTYGVDDIPLVIQDKTFDSTMAIVETGLSHIMVINGAIKPYLNAPAQMVRFRALNASAARHYLLGWSDSTDLIQIASDGGLLAKPIRLKRIMLAPGERVEFVVDLNNRVGDSLTLMSFAPEMPRGAAGQGPVFAPGLPGENSLLNGAVFPLLKLNVTVPTTNPVISAPPNPLSVLPKMPDTSGIGITRILTIQSPNNGAGGPFYFNGEFYDEIVMNQIVPLGKTEIWEINNRTLIGHPFHLHGGSYFMLQRNGEVPPENEQGLKDVWYVGLGKKIRILVRFDNYSDSIVPFMYHCHMLGHEDGGLMGNVLVVDSTYTSSRNIKDKKHNILINLDQISKCILINAEWSKQVELTTEIYSVSGQLILKNTEKVQGSYYKSYTMDIHSSGMWIVKLRVDDENFIKKIILTK